MKLVKQDEMQKFSSKTGLARTLSEVILEWEDEDGSRWYRRSNYHDIIADNLAKIIRLQKRNMTGKLNGNYLGHLTFKKLKKYYSDTEISKLNDTWYENYSVSALSYFSEK
jgi:hypothetical protein